MGVQKSLNAVSHEDKIKKCPECGSEEVKFEDGERYCGKCGLLID